MNDKRQDPNAKDAAHAPAERRPTAPGDRGTPTPDIADLSSTGQADRRRVQEELSDRLRHRGVHLDGRETGAELANLMDAVERFEAAVEGSGGDLMVDEPIEGAAPIDPDDLAFVLPVREPRESPADFMQRIGEATQRARGRRDD